MYEYAICIGRFQPAHLGHKAMIDAALVNAEKVIIVVGSSGQPATIKNPFPFEFRKRLISCMYPIETRSRLIIIPGIDYPYDDYRWKRELKKDIQRITKSESIMLIGHTKDESSYYLSIFPEWGYGELPNFGEFSASDIREYFFSYEDGGRLVAEMLHPESLKLLYEYFNQNQSILVDLVEEYSLVNTYKDRAKNYPRIEQTVDSVVIQNGRVLMIRRKNAPGKGQWALPGGFLEPDETMVQSAIRELYEETNINLTPQKLRDALSNQEGFVYSAPGRDLRGRVITTAFTFHLPPSCTQVEVQAADDADDVCWQTISTLSVIRHLIYADHYSIIQDCID